MSFEFVTEPKISVLIIENDREELKFFGTTLKHQGYGALFATNGQQALKIAKNKLPDIIILGLSILDMDAYEVCKALKSNTETISIPVLFVIPFTKRDICDNLIVGIGGSDIIMHPINASELSYKIRTQFELTQLKNSVTATKLIVETELEKVINIIKEYLDNMHIGSNKKEKITLLKDNITNSLNKLAEVNSVFREERTIISDTIDEISGSGYILLVEDNELNQTFTSSVLREAGYNVIVAGTGQKAIEDARKYHFDLVLLDMNLPDMAGDEVYNELIKYEGTQPIIAISGYSKDEIDKKKSSVIFSDYILKPIDAKELIKKVQNFTRNASLSKPGKIKHTKYDYSRAFALSGNSNTKFQKWGEEFLNLLESCQSGTQHSQNNGVIEIDHKVLHGLLNYSIYFGAHKLKNMIRELNDSNSDSFTERRAVLITEINKEVKSLYDYYCEIFR